MSQEEWTKTLVTFIEENWYSKGFLRDNYNDGSISYSIKKKKIKFWITSSNQEISVGFNDERKNCTWHTHMSLFGANTTEEQIEELKKIVEQVINNRIKITCSSKYGYWLSSDIEEKYRDEDEVIEFKTWDEL